MVKISSENLESLGLNCNLILFLLYRIRFFFIASLLLLHEFRSFLSYAQC